MINKFDKLKVLSHEQFFGEMNLEDYEISERVAMAYALQECFYELFTIIKRDYNDGKDIVSKYDEYVSTVTALLFAVFEAEGYYADDYPYIESQIVPDMSEGVVDTTIRNLNDDNSETLTENVLSMERAMGYAQGVTNQVTNRIRHEEYASAGYKTKTWITMRDNRVRETHTEVDGITIPVDELFVVGSSRMMFPCDISYGADMSEIMNCRCVVEYRK